MGYTSSAFGILVSKGRAPHHIWFNLIAKQIIFTVNGKHVIFEHPYTEEVNRYVPEEEKTKTSDNVIFTDVTINLFSDLKYDGSYYGYGSKQEDYFYEYTKLLYSENNNIEIGPTSRDDVLIGFEIDFFNDKTEEMAISPSTLVSLETFRAKLVSDRRISSTVDYVLTSSFSK